MISKLLILLIPYNQFDLFTLFKSVSEKNHHHSSVSNQFQNKSRKNYEINN